MYDIYMEENIHNEIEEADNSSDQNESPTYKKPREYDKKIVIAVGLLVIFLISVLVVFLLTKESVPQNNYSARRVLVPQQQIIKPTLLPTPTASQAPLSSIPIYQQMLANDKPGYDYAISKGVQFSTTKDGKSFFMYWKPDGWSELHPKKLIVNLSGHGVYVTQGFSDWYGILTDKNQFAILSLQWWDGEGEKYQDYYTPEEIMSEVNNFLAANNFTKDDLIVLHGFSRGSANSYAVAAIDASQNSYFDINIANAGGASLDFPGNQAIQNGNYGVRPLANTKWILFCGEKDPNPEQSGCPGMDTTKIWLEKNGAEIILFLKDPTGNHGAFMKNAINAKSALNTILSQYK